MEEFNFGNFEDLVDDVTEIKNRENCKKCTRPIKVCLCKYIGNETNIHNIIILYDISY